MSDITGFLFVAVLFVVAAALVVSMIERQFPRVTVLEFERGLRYVRGRFTGVLGAGQYRTWSTTTVIRKIDIRPRVASVAGQEVLSADGVALKVSLVARYRVVDPAVAVNNVENYEVALHTTLQLALRAAVAASPVESLLQARATLGKEITEQSIAPAAAAGLELLGADLKDLTLPGELKKIFTQVVQARQEGLAALEKARGETAALRNLANAAQMIERSPGLMQLRTLQAFGQQSGNTLVLGIPTNAVVPVRGTASE